MVAKNFNLTNNIYIPKQVFLKFCDINRNDTIDGKLSFPSYFKSKTKLAHEKAMSKWGNNDIPTKIIENKPQDGYIINLSIARSSDWNSSGRSMLRIYSPEEYEFEISIENFCYICEYADISKKYISCELIVGFSGGKIILIPTNSPLYEQAKKDTDVIDGVVHVLDRKNELSENLIVGETYTSKHSNYLYLGEFTIPKMKHTHFITQRYSNKNINNLTRQHYDLLGVTLNLFTQGGIKSIYNDISIVAKKEHLVISHQDINKENSFTPLTLTQIKNMKAKKWDNEEDKIRFFGQNNFDSNGKINIQKVFSNGINYYSRGNCIEIKEEISLTDLRSIYALNPNILDLTYKTTYLRDREKQLNSFTSLTSKERIIHITKETLSVDHKSKEAIVSISVYIGERNNKKLEFNKVKEFIFAVEQFTDHNFLGDRGKMIELDWKKNTALSHQEVTMLIHPINIMSNVEKYILSEISIDAETEQPREEHMVMLTTKNERTGNKVLLLLDNTTRGNVNELIFGDRILKDSFY